MANRPLHTKLAAELEAVCQTKASPRFPVAVFVQGRRFTYKKTLMASEQEHADVRQARRAWIARLPRMRLEPHRLVFLDETSTNTRMCQLYGRSLCWTRLKAPAPFGRWGTQTFIVGLRCAAVMDDQLLNVYPSIFSNQHAKSFSSRIRSGCIISCDGEVVGHSAGLKQGPKRGDGYLRRLLVHGARAVVGWRNRRPVSRDRWLSENHL